VLSDCVWSDWGNQRQIIADLYLLISSLFLRGNVIC
jgi:hypothetical protein